MKDLAAIVLAAGRSQRMGAFKPLLPFGPSTVIKSCVKHLRDGGVPYVIVVTGKNPEAELLKQHLADVPVVFAVNPNPLSEMSDSIACGVAALPDHAKAVLITPADLPAVPSEVVAAVINEWRSGGRLVVPTFDQRGGHPVLVDLEFRAELLDLATERGLKGLFRAHSDRVSRLAVNSNYIARDMDTWDDYRVLHEEVFGVRPQGRLSDDEKSSKSGR